MSSSKPDIRRLTFASPAYDAAVRLRRAVLRAPLGLDFAQEQLAAEDTDIHLGAFDGETLIGVCILTPYQPGIFKLRQMAVSDAARGTGTGAALLKAAEDASREAGGTRLVLEARLTARGFYERYGYKAFGDEFVQVTLPHISMDKSI